VYFGQNQNNSIEDNVKEISQRMEQELIVMFLMSIRMEKNERINEERSRVQLMSYGKKHNEHRT
jgi:hypothetical protein